MATLTRNNGNPLKNYEDLKDPNDFDIILELAILIALAALIILII